MRLVPTLLAASLLAACAPTPDVRTAQTPPPMLEEVQVLAINDFHGRLEAPGRAIPVRLADGTRALVPSGGAAYLAGALDALDAKVPGEALRVAAGDMIGASPLASALFLDEPTIDVLEMMELDYSALGNHEFDKGIAELLRLTKGGCEMFTKVTPCALDGSYDGADFTYLAANVFLEDGNTLFPDAAVEQVGGHTIGIIGLPLAGVPGLVAPNLVDGLRFADEVETANALVPHLKEMGAETIVLLIHEGGQVGGEWDDPACPELSGAVVDMLDGLDPAIGVIASGHTHNAYSCQVPMPNGMPGTRLLTSAGAYGALVTDIRLHFAKDGGQFVGATGQNVAVQGDAFRDRDGALVLPNDGYARFAPDPEVAALVARVVEKARPLAERVVGSLEGSVSKDDATAGYLIADAQWAATADPANGGAQLALMNAGGVRTDLAAGTVTYGQIFALQPFQNSLMTLSLTGAQLKAVLEQGVAGEGMPRFIRPSRQLAYSFDRSRPEGARIVELTFEGAPVDPAATYRVTANNFIAYGGDGYTVLREGTDATGAGTDVEALAAWLADGRAAPEAGRVRDVTPAN
ncbi:bifunctional metallophosphatase/5'-nucleotidase [Sphingomicrobium nitratireducens]|uniref:bifunctional metallophosphatase/5'-nucleotidase n=1 Tax=Sphingomicrobium nitratireducens TaxID=2964666 RepID=UPI00223F8A1B|nr:bifunctional metallophosphatase/5'-nucleotidase [Sphingomicrobium nitratireducens]